MLLACCSGDGCISLLEVIVCLLCTSYIAFSGCMYLDHDGYFTQYVITN